MSAEDKIKLWQIERGDELAKIDKKIDVNDAVPIRGDVDIYDRKTFKESPHSEKNATSKNGLVRKEQMDDALAEKANKTEVVNLNSDQTKDGELIFNDNPKSINAATDPKGLVNKEQLDTALKNKVDKVTGKGLSTKDFTAAAETKLGGIEAGAQKNTVDSVNGKTGVVSVTKSDVGLSKADNTSDADKPVSTPQQTELNKKVDKVDGKGLSTVDFTVDLESKVGEIDGKATKIDIPAGTTDLRLLGADGRVLSDVSLGFLVANISMEYDEETGRIIIKDGEGVEISSFDASDLIKGLGKKLDFSGVDLQLLDISNEVISSVEVGISNVSGLSTALSKKVDKVTGKGLSTKDFTAAAETKLGGIEAGAQKNTVDSVNGKTGVVSVTKSDVGLSKVDNTSDADKPVSTPQQAELNKKVDKVTGKGLSTKDFTAAAETKLSEIEAKAQVNVQSDFIENNIDHDAFIHNKAASVTVEDEFVHTEGEPQIFDVKCKSTKLLGCYLNGQKLSKNNFDIRANGYEIIIPLYGTNTISIVYETEVIFSNIHGFQFDTTIAAPEVQNIGNSELNTSLPIQSLMRRCLVDDSGNVLNYLDKDNSNLLENSDDALLDGTEGQVMVEVPRYWYIDRTDGNIRKYMISLTPFPGAQESPLYYVGAYKAALDRSNNTLASVRNLTADFRGGGNQSNWDSENAFKSQIGKPASAISRINFDTYAEKRGKGWKAIDIHMREDIAWLFTHEYGTRDHQSVFVGATTVGSTNWTDFNGYYPLFQCGITNTLGNKSGEIEITLQDFPSVALTEKIKVFSYRGIENFYGDIWEWTGGVNILNNIYYLNPRLRKTISNTETDGYLEIGKRPTANGYIKKNYPGTILPQDTGGSSSTFYADYLYSNDNESLRGVRCGGSAHAGSRAGSFVVSSITAPTFTYATSGSRLCFFKR